MPILELQRRIAEAGRIRIGRQVAIAGGKTRPAKLETFRLTSQHRDLIEEAAARYGGQVARWDAPAGQQWEVITETDRLNVIVPPTPMAFSQWFEMWSAGGAIRRCDTVTETISDGPCICAREGGERQCDYHTRLSVMLRDLRGLGVWRLDSQGYNAAVELAGVVETLDAAAGHGILLPAVLWLEQRMVKRTGETTRRFAVPRLDIQITPEQLLALGANGQVPAGALRSLELASSPALEPAPPVEHVLDEPPAPDQPPARKRAGRRGLTPIPPAGQPASPAGSVAEQITGEPPTPRKRRAPAIPKTGVRPRTAAQARAGAVTATEPAPARPPDEAQQPPPAPAGGADRPASPEQNRKMHALFREAGLGDRDDRLILTGEILGHPVDTSAGLTNAQAQKLIDTLERHQVDGTLDDYVTATLTAWAAKAAVEESGEQEAAAAYNDDDTGGDGDDPTGAWSDEHEYDGDTDDDADQ